jgi:hypothetical protein
MKDLFSTELKLELNMVKTKRTNLDSEYAHFLGHYIKAQTLSKNHPEKDQSTS